MKIKKAEKFLRPVETIPFTKLMKKIEDNKFNNNNIKQLNKHVAKSLMDVTHITGPETM